LRGIGIGSGRTLIRPIAHRSATLVAHFDGGDDDGDNSDNDDEISNDSAARVFRSDHQRSGGNSNAAAVGSAFDGAAAGESRRIGETAALKRADIERATLLVVRAARIAERCMRTTIRFAIVLFSWGAACLHFSLLRVHALSLFLAVLLVVFSKSSHSLCSFRSFACLLCFFPRVRAVMIVMSNLETPTA
jgi:hypothetical protein